MFKNLQELFEKHSRCKKTYRFGKVRVKTNVDSMLVNFAITKGERVGFKDSDMIQWYRLARIKNKFGWVKAERTKGLTKTVKIRANVGYEF